jgi:AraC-like DNA-binding protein
MDIRYKAYKDTQPQKAKYFLDVVWNDRIYRDPGFDQDAMCELLELKPVQLAMIFRRNFDMTYLQIFKHCKVADVQQILADPNNVDLPIAEVAIMAGYPKRPSFNIHFKEVVGMSPTEFRYFHKHFVKTTGVNFAEYQQEENPVYLPEDRKPTFLSNFLNKCVQKLRR